MCKRLLHWYTSGLCGVLRPTECGDAMQVGYYRNLTALIEHAVDSNDGRQATIVAHSLGCLVSLYFITQQPSEWLQKHVNSFVAVSAPWAGSITALKGKPTAHACTLLASL